MNMYSPMIDFGQHLARELLYNGLLDIKQRLDQEVVQMLVVVRSGWVVIIVIIVVVIVLVVIKLIMGASLGVAVRL